MTDQLSVESIAATLQELPKSLESSDAEIARLEIQVDEEKENLELAEVNASLSATLDGKNAEARELQKKKAIADNIEVKLARSVFSSAQQALEIKRAENKSLARQFAGYCHIAELKAAQMNLMSKGATK